MTMGKVISLPVSQSGEINVKTETISVRVIHVGTKKMTRSFFNQIPVARPEKWPQMRLGWVQTNIPVLIYQDEEGRLRRMDITNWGIWKDGKCTKRATEYTPQIFIGR